MAHSTAVAAHADAIQSEATPIVRQARPTFAELARRGWIRAANGAAGDYLLTSQYWQQLLTPNYHRGGPIYDHALGEAVFHHLQPGLD